MFAAAAAFCLLLTDLVLLVKAGWTADSREETVQICGACCCKLMLFFLPNQQLQSAREKSLV